MKTFRRFISLLVILCVVLPLSAAEWVDYVSQLKLDMKSSTLKQVVTVRNYVDGDTTHFIVPKSLIDNGVLKARYLACNTPESTGKIEPYGKAASDFTKSRLSGAVSIIIESDDEILNKDSTGSRYLVWVWYRTSQDDEYRNLNLELLQNGLAIASSAANNRYGSYCTAAIAQAKEYRLNVYSGEKDPGFYYGEAVELTLKELRANIGQYDGMKVAFEGVITSYYNNGVFVEDYDEETEMYNGMYVYIGFGLRGSALNMLDVGNRTRIVGTVSYYETGGTYQVSGLQYKASKPNDPSNLKLISKGNSAGYKVTDPDVFVNGKIGIGEDDEVKEYDYAALAMGSSISMENLFVRETYTTDDPDSSSFGAMTLYCEKDGVEVQVRTVVLTDGNRNIITADAYEGKTVSVRGFVDFHDGVYQIKVLMSKDITIID